MDYSNKQKLPLRILLSLFFKQEQNIIFHACSSGYEDA